MMCSEGDAAGSVPHVDMLFENEDDAYALYTRYAGELGFSVRKSSKSRRLEYGITARTFVCSREGSRQQRRGDEPKNPRPATRTGCPARMRIKFTPDCVFRVTEFVPEHNHPLAEPSTANKPRSQQAKPKASVDASCQRKRTPVEDAGDAVDCPHVEMLFENEEDAYAFYNQYAEHVGFSVRKSNKSMKRKGGLTARTFVCFRQGFREQKRGHETKNRRLETRTGCPARMKIKLNPGGVFSVTEFVPDHNHPLADPSIAHRLRSHRAKSKGNSEGSNDRQSRPMKKVGDAGAALEYLQRMQVESPCFFYAVQMDGAGNMTNFFWADAKSMMDYRHFGDAVCFDTTYKANDYGRPLALFLGVNNHRQMIVFGSALLYDESEESLRWLFGTFKNAMRGKQPKTILTDRSEEMTIAVAAVWSGIVHRVCLWHVYQNAMKCLNKIIQGSKSFLDDLSHCLFDYEEEEGFISAWKRMIEKYDLSDNELLAELYNDREKWALPYRRQAFCADMFSTLRKENLISPFKKCLSSEQDLCCFLENYDRLLVERRCAELQADLHASQNNMKVPSLRMFRQAINAYTPAVFEMFLTEFEMHVDCMVYHCGEVGSTSEYKVTVDEEPIDHIVRCDTSDGSIFCSCKKFEFVGIQCRHVLKVFDYRNIKELPSRYILKRWRKDAKFGAIKDNHEYASDGNSKLLANHDSYLCHLFSMIAARAAKTMEAYKFIESQSDLLLEQIGAHFAENRVS